MNQISKLSTEPACKGLFAWITTVVFVLPPYAVRADIVTEWNERAFAAIEAEKLTGGFGPARILTIMHAAMFDAVNAVDKHYTPYSGATLDATGASPEVAVHAAARRALAELLPRQTPMLDAAFAACISARAPKSATPLANKSATTCYRTTCGRLVDRAESPLRFAIGSGETLHISGRVVHQAVNPSPDTPFKAVTFGVFEKGQPDTSVVGE